MKLKEKDFYKPIKEYFENIVSKDLKWSLRLWEAHGSIPEELKLIYPDIQEILNVYSYSPDLIGIVDANPKKLIVIEVKDDPLSLHDLYQVKRYSEIIKADYSFLISPDSFLREDEQLLKNEEIEHIQNFYVNSNSKIIIKQIIVGKLNFEIVGDEIKIKNIFFDNAITQE